MDSVFQGTLNYIKCTNIFLQPSIFDYNFGNEIHNLSFVIYNKYIAIFNYNYSHYSINMSTT